MSYLDEHRNEIFKKYSNEELKKDCENFINGKGRLQKFLNHFLKWYFQAILDLFYIDHKQLSTYVYEMPKD